MPSGVIEALVDVYRRYSEETGIQGVALGPKEVAGTADATSRSGIAFVVAEKKPRQGARRRLADGSKLLPRRVDAAGRRYVTDVVESAPAAAAGAKPRMQRTRFTAGGPLSGRGGIGTFGCLVQRTGSRWVYALTNHHVGGSVGRRVFFPSSMAPGAVGAATRFAVRSMADEAFEPFVDQPDVMFHVDAALPQVPHPQLPRFSPRIPTLGVPEAIFEPDESSAEAYAKSMVGTPVWAWSWNSKQRSGEISHVLYVTGSALPGVQLMYSFLVRGTGGVVPSLPRDSGKAWVTKGEGGRLELVGLHVGGASLSDEPCALAVATDMHALARVLKIKPYVADQPS